MDSSKPLYVPKIKLNNLILAVTSAIEKKDMVELVLLYKFSEVVRKYITENFVIIAEVLELPKFKSFQEIVTAYDITKLKHIRNKKEFFNYAFDTQNLEVVKFACNRFAILLADFDKLHIYMPFICEMMEYKRQQLELYPDLKKYLIYAMSCQRSIWISKFYDVSQNNETYGRRGRSQSPEKKNPGNGLIFFQAYLGNYDPLQSILNHETFTMLLEEAKNNDLYITVEYINQEILKFSWDMESREG